MGGVIKGVSNAAGPVMKGLDVSPIIQQAMGQIAQSGDQRAAFKAILLATAASVAKKPSFNLELEMNDLYIRLGNLRGAAQSAGMGGGPFGAIGQQMSQMTQMTNHMSAMLGNIDSAIQNIVKNIK